MLAAADPAALPPAAGFPKSWEPPVEARAWTCMVLHHSGTTQGDVASLDATHRRRVDSAGKPWLGIGYHFVVGNGQGMADGLVEPTFRWRQQLAGAHAGEARTNETGIGICLIGNFQETTPSGRQLAATKSLVAALATHYQIPRGRVLLHQDVRATECPGRLFPVADVLAAVPSARTLPQPEPSPE